MSGPTGSRRRRTPASRPLAPRVTSLQRGRFGLFLSAVLVLKLAVMLRLKDHALTQPDAGLDTTAYAALAERVVGGDITLGPGLYFVSPLYIYFLAAVLAVWHSFTIVRLLQIGLGTGAVALVYVTANEWFGQRAAWIAAMFAALTGLFTFYESLLLQTALDPFLTAAAMAGLALGLKRNHGYRYVLLAGLTFGVQACNRPNVAFPAAVIAVLFAATPRWRAAAIFSTGLAVALAPVTLRNITVSHSWSPLAASHGGLNFYIGNNDQADGTYHAVPGITPDITGQQEDTRRVAEQATGHPLDDAGVSSYFYRRGWAWIRDRPAAAAKLFARKVSLVLTGSYIWLNYSYPFFVHDERTLLPALFVGPWLLIPLGLLGLVVAMPTVGRTAYLVWGSFVPTYGLAVAAFYVSDRYQLPLLIWFCAGAGAAVDALLRAISARRWAASAAAASGFVILAAFVNRPLSLDDGVAEERTRMSERMATLGRFVEAERWAERAATVHPHPGVVHFRLAQQLVARDQTAAAIGHFQAALRLEPGQPVVEYALGETLIEAGRASEAIEPLQRALAAGVHADQAGEDLVRALGASGDQAGALRVLRTLRPARDDDAGRWVALGRLAIQLREPRLAETFAGKALAARPDLAAAHGQLGDGFNLEGRWTDAARELAEAIRLDPLDPAPHIGLAVAEAGAGRMDNARREIETALRLDPRSEPARRLQQALEVRAK